MVARLWVVFKLFFVCIGVIYFSKCGWMGDGGSSPPLTTNLITN